MSNVVMSANGTGPTSTLASAGERAEEIHLPTPPTSLEMPESEEEVKEFFRRQIGNDPAKLRMAAQETAGNAAKVAAILQGMAEEKERENGAATATHATPALAPSTPTAAPVESPIVVTQVATPVATPTAPAAPAPATSNPAVRRPIEVPPTYQPVPEGAYYWSPDIWGGRPLHCVPRRVVEREGRSTLILAVLMAPAYGRTRAGRIVSLPEGARVIVHLNPSWSPVAPLAVGPLGRPVLFAVPMTLDTSVHPHRPRIAQPGEPLFKFETGDGGWEYAMSIHFDPDPKDPTRPRLVPLDVLDAAEDPTSAGASAGARA